MKLLASGIALIVCCSALAQNSPASDSRTFSVFAVSENVVITFGPGNEVLFIRPPKNSTSGTRAVTVFETDAYHQVYISVPSSTSARINKSDNVVRSGDLVQLRGNVEVHTPGTFVQADDVDYHLSTGEMEPRGNVRIKPATD